MGEVSSKWFKLQSVRLCSFCGGLAAGDSGYICAVPAKTHLAHDLRISAAISFHCAALLERTYFPSMRPPAILAKGAPWNLALATNIASDAKSVVVPLARSTLESVKSKHPQLMYESKLYRILQGGTGVPNIRWSGVEGDYNVLVLDLLGPSLEDLFNFCSRKFSLKTALMLADQLINRIEYVHSKSFLHRDIKPDNFLMGLGRRANQVYIIDFGLAKKYRDPASHQHIPYSSCTQNEVKNKSISLSGIPFLKSYSRILCQLSVSLKLKETSVTIIHIEASVDKGVE
ncbi:hypothetical protein L7F22_064555 [Adiantum nelumboides]|nr:hypothetical protein [Adiantum nelumboides]